MIARRMVQLAVLVLVVVAYVLVFTHGTIAFQNL